MYLYFFLLFLQTEKESKYGFDFIWPGKETSHVIMGKKEINVSLQVHNLLYKWEIEYTNNRQIDLFEFCQISNSNSRLFPS